MHARGYNRQGAGMAKRRESASHKGELGSIFVSKQQRHTNGPAQLNSIRHSVTQTNAHTQHVQAYTEFRNDGRSGKPQYETMLAMLNEAESSTAPILYYQTKVICLKLSLARRKPSELEKLIFCCGSDLNAIVKSELVRRRYVYRTRIL